MNDILTYIQQNPLGAAVLCGAGAFLVATLAALVAALRGGAGRLFGEYRALGRSFSDSRQAQERQDAAYNELHARVSELNRPQDPTHDDQPTPQP